MLQIFVITSLVCLLAYVFIYETGLYNKASKYLKGEVKYETFDNIRFKLVPYKTFGKFNVPEEDRYEVYYKTPNYNKWCKYITPIGLEAYGSLFTYDEYNSIKDEILSKWRSIENK